MVTQTLKYGHSYELPNFISIKFIGFVAKLPHIKIGFGAKPPQKGLLYKSLPLSLSYGNSIFKGAGYARCRWHTPLFLSHLTMHCMSLVMSLLLLIGSITPTEAPQRLMQTGKASFYAKKFTGCRTFYGERVSAEALAGAHRTLPRNTLVEVTNLRNHRSVIIRINDRGPFAKGRIVDLTYAAAKAIGMISSGVATVSLRVVSDKSQVATLSTATAPDAAVTLPTLD